MKKIFLFLIATTIFSIALEFGKVVTVIDGDTIMLKKSSGETMKARLIGLDTFETKVNHRAFLQLATLKLIHPFKAHTIKEVLHFGYKAKEFSVNRVLNKTVEYSSYGLDKYGRELVYIQYLNYPLIRYGLAIQYPTNKLPQKMKQFLLKASKEANLEQRGIYAK